MCSANLGSLFNSRQSSQNVSQIRQDEVTRLVDKSILGNEQRFVFDALENSTESFFITGRAGTGKSFLLDFFVKNSRKKVVVVAPTGVAAINVGGQTIHSFFGIPPKTPIPYEEIIPGTRKKELFRCLETVVIDEISMVRADVMDAIDYILKISNKNDLPFGGKQVLMFGDLYQLPPVARPQVKRYLDDVFGGVFFFNASVIRQNGIRYYELTHVFRQKDPVFIDILNQVREGEITEESLSILNRRAAVPVPDDEEIAIMIAPRRDTVDRANESMLENIDEPLYIYEAHVEGDFKETEFPALKTLKLKVGARVMMLANDQGDESGFANEGRRWVNGTLGQISRLSKDSIWVMINGVSHQINKHTWHKSQYSYDSATKQLSSRPTAMFTQFPVALAWAITVHKAQGATYQSVGIDLDKGMFAEGQTYVALSRCTDMERLYLTRPISGDDIMTSAAVKSFMGD